MNFTLSRTAFGMLVIASAAFGACKDDTEPGNTQQADGSSQPPDGATDDVQADDVQVDVQADAGDPGADVEGDADQDVDLDVVEADGSSDPDFWRDLEPCVPVATEASQLQAGELEDGAVLAPGGRALVSAGTTVDLPGFPANLVLSADETLAYVLSTSNDDRRVLVVQVSDGTVLQNVELPEAFQGIAIDVTRGQLYVSGGGEKQLHVLPINAEDGTLGTRTTVDMPTYTSDVLLLPDGSRLLVGSFTRSEFYELDPDAIGTESMIVETRSVARPVWDLIYLPGRDEVVASSISGAGISFVRRSDGVTEPLVETGRSTTGLAFSADEATVWVANSGIDEVVAVNVADRSVAGRAHVSEGDLTDADGLVLGRSNVNSVTVSSDGTRLYASRSSDNAVSVFDTSDLSLLGAFPTAWHPSGTFLVSGGERMLITEGKGFGSGPSNGRRSMDVLDGSVTFVDLTTLDLDETTSQVLANFNRSTDVFPFECNDGFFPIPTRPEQRTPIEHVILVVKENKTFDCVFGDIEDLDIDVDPTLVRWGQELTPNQHALAHDFNISDNFYDEVEDSDMGHIYLTAGYLSEYAERVWMEAQRTKQFLGFQLNARELAADGNLFTHLMDNGIDIQVYGEIVGMTDVAASGQTPGDFSDPGYPGGPFYNLGARDADRAQYVVDQMNTNGLARFTYILLPNDHTGGVTPGNPTPETQVADNDYGVGILVDGLSHSEYWANTVILVLEDDPQGCLDHVDSHRSFLLAISPWAKRNHVSHVNTNYQSVFATITRILGVPPMGRPDASSAPLWDLFTATPDFEPWTAIPREIPEEKIRRADVPGAQESMRMDFRGPDRNENLGLILDNYRLWQMGRITEQEAHDRIERGILSRPSIGALDDQDFEEAEEEREEEAEEERFSFDVEYEHYVEWARARGRTVPPLTGAPMDEETIRAINAGRIDLQRFDRFAPAALPEIVLP
jgi:DNA-binding beta-propeller fold protein YncE